MGAKNSITAYFGANLAELLTEQITKEHPKFDGESYIKAIETKCPDKSYTQRIELHADELRTHLPPDYENALAILLKILGPENLEETGMFKNYYWIMPIGKFVEKYGLDHYDKSIGAIAEITKRNTGEYAIRPYIRQFPEKTLKIMKKWAQSDNFHLRRLASEGLRPKLPWAPKLDTFIDDPNPVFEILEILKKDSIKFVQKSVANHITDYIKVNPDTTWGLIAAWKKSKNKNTQWVVKHATRKYN